MRLSRCTVAYLVLTAFVAVSSSSLAQDDNGSSRHVEIAGASLPTQFGVQEFYGLLFELYRADEDGEYRPYIRAQFGIEKAPDVQVLTRSMLLAISLEVEKLDAKALNEVSAEVAESRQHSLRLRKARDLGEIYWPMLEELRGRGIDISRIEMYIDEEVRRKQSLFTESASLDKYLAAEREFLAPKDGAQ